MKESQNFQDAKSKFDISILKYSLKLYLKRKSLLHLALFEKGNIIISNHQLSIVIEISGRFRQTLTFVRRETAENEFSRPILYTFLKQSSILLFIYCLAKHLWCLAMTASC